MMQLVHWEVWMPQIDKHVISQYIKTECKRQLRFDLSPDNAKFRHERKSEKMPPPIPPRPGLPAITKAGRDWEDEKFNELYRYFGSNHLVGDYTIQSGKVKFSKINLFDVIDNITANQFILESEYEVGDTFVKSLQLNDLRNTFGLEFASLRPDIIVSQPSGTNLYGVGVSGDTFLIDNDDARIQLVIIDVKLTSEPSPGYFSEIAYYSIALSCWLTDNNLDDRFVVVKNGAIWPGSHEQSKLYLEHQVHQDLGTKPTFQAMYSAFLDDLEEVPFEVFAYRIRKILKNDVEEVLHSKWPDLNWHVDNRCKNCEYLGYPWPNITINPDHCMPAAGMIGQLSQVAFLSKGARSVLEKSGVSNVSSLATLTPNSSEFDKHQSLRTTRNVIAGRAQSLAAGNAFIPVDSGTSAILPKWSDLRIYITCDFDIGSAISFSFGIKAFWVEPFDVNNKAKRQTKSWRARTFIVDLKSLQAEQREFLAFLEYLNSILTDADVSAHDSTFQIYLWDELRYKHLCRVAGRHLNALLSNASIDHLAWLFPPDEILANPSNETRMSPITLVQDVVKSVLAAPIPHYYNLLEVARNFHLSSLPASIAKFQVHPLFEDALSDQIPSERAHEIWLRSIKQTSHWQLQMGRLHETESKHLNALEAVAAKLEDELRGLLNKTAPKINISPPDRLPAASIDGQLWYAFSRLNNALEKLDIDLSRSRPVYEREARFVSARLTRRILGKEEDTILNRFGVPRKVGRRVYQLNTNSKEVKARDGDFTWALSPEDQSGFLDQSFFRLTHGTSISVQGWEMGWAMEKATAVKIVILDRDSEIIIIDANAYKRPELLDEMESEGVADFSKNVVLDPVHVDIFNKKLKESIKSIGNPPISKTNSVVEKAIGSVRWKRMPRVTKPCPAADFLWDAKNLNSSAISKKNLPVIKGILDNHDVELNDMQWLAWKESISRRLHLIWGPPGTGKSRTLRAIVLGESIEACENSKSVRILISAATWAAIDVVLLECSELIIRCLPTADIKIYRLRSPSRSFDLDPSYDWLDAELDKAKPSQKIEQLLSRLTNSIGVTIVGSTPDQIHNLMLTNGGPQAELFDHIIIDESSQMDVGHAIVDLCSLANNGSVTLAGDPLQLPPIHQAEAPLGLESMVGSIYDFYAKHHGVEQTMLERNYRSNESIVNFSINAGYRPQLIAHSPKLTLTMNSPVPKTQPSSWPKELYWTSEWAALLDENEPTACFVYQEGISSQWNQFEADAIASLLYLLSSRMSVGLGNEIDIHGNTLPINNNVYSQTEFWKRGVGVVTPHRAQQGLVISRLQQLFTPQGVDSSLIRSAVDTVERFQGQQRDVMLATFALGDPDSIRDEDEFLMSLNRFNVMASRARAKLIVLVSQEVVDHLSHDIDTMRGSRLLKSYVETFCDNSREMTLGVIENGVARDVQGLYKYKSA